MPIFEALVAAGARVVCRPHPFSVSDPESAAQIEQARHTLAAWNENAAAYRQAHGEVLKPLQAELLAGPKRQTAFEDALKKRFSAKVLDGLTVPAAGLNSDLHGSAEYRAHLIAVLARRAVEAATGKA